MNIGEIYKVNGTDYVVIGGSKSTETATVVPMDKTNDVEKHFRPMDIAALTEHIGEIGTSLLTQMRNKIKTMLGWA